MVLMMTNRDFVNFCKKALGKPVMYMWGTYGRPITEDLIAAKAKQYPTHYDAAYRAELRAKIGTGKEYPTDIPGEFRQEIPIGCDCTGLIKWFLWTKGDIDAKVPYDGNTDHSASGWYNAAKVRGKIDTVPERPGLIVSMPGHCGVYIGNGEVIECTIGKFGNGVVKTKLTDRDWEKWCECKYIDYETEPEETRCEITTIPARVKKDCPAYSGLNKRHQIGAVYTEDAVLYIGRYGGMAAVIYPTSATQKIAFVDISNIVF